MAETQMTSDEFEIMQLKAEILRLKAERDFLIAWLEGIFADARATNAALDLPIEQGHCEAIVERGGDLVRLCIVPQTASSISVSIPMIRHWINRVDFQSTPRLLRPARAAPIGSLPPRISGKLSFIARSSNRAMQDIAPYPPLSGRRDCFFPHRIEPAARLSETPSWEPKKQSSRYQCG